MAGLLTFPGLTSFPSHAKTVELRYGQTFLKGSQQRVLFRIRTGFPINAWRPDAASQP